MPRPASDPTHTLSICVTDAERQTIRDAAHAADISVSGWGFGKLHASVATPARVKQVKALADKMAATFVPRGARSARVSIVMPQAEFVIIEAVSTKLGITSHLLAQAVLLHAAEADLEANPQAERREPEVIKRTPRAPRAEPASGLEVMIPADLAGLVDPASLGAMLLRLAAATAAKILEGGGRTIAEGTRSWAARYEGADMQAVRLAVDPFELAAPAHVLGVSAGAYATVMAVKAIKALASV